MAGNSPWHHQTHGLYYAAPVAVVGEGSFLSQCCGKPLGLQDQMHCMFAFHVEMRGGDACYCQAAEQEDAGEFRRAVEEEAAGCVNSGHCKQVGKSEVPEDRDTIPSVWSMQHKHSPPPTSKIAKYRAHLSAHIGKQDPGVSCFDTCTTVVAWSVIQPIAVGGIVSSWSLGQVGFAAAYMQPWSLLSSSWLAKSTAMYSGDAVHFYNS